MDFLAGIHSWLRWILLIIFIWALVNAFRKWKAGREYGAKDKLINLLTMVLMHTQLLIGLVLYFGNSHYKGFKHMDVAVTRFFAMEHLVGMVLAVILITLGRKRAEASQRGRAKHRKIAIWYGIVLVVVLASIPWPFRFEHIEWFSF